MRDEEDEARAEDDGERAREGELLSDRRAPSREDEPPQHGEEETVPHPGADPDRDLLPPEIYGAPQPVEHRADGGGEELDEQRRAHRAGDRHDEQRVAGDESEEADRAGCGLAE